ncbi:MAG TPA: TetR/AcrR family transcriptional regulator, partial [Myxococcota bacterium]|nr:TetR/AcrR family transcriptional regulator [Myxococcota bacterium]
WRERILAAALDAFSERGFDGATTREIAARAGVNLGLLQYYFEGKENLWRAAVDRAFEQIRETFEGVLDGAADEDARTRLLIRTWVRFVAERPEFVRLMHDEGKHDGPRMRWLVDEHVRPLYQTIRALLERARQAGRLPAHVDALHFHYILVGAVALIFHQAEECKRLTGVDPSDPAVIEKHADAVELLLLGPPPKETSR